MGLASRLLRNLDRIVEDVSPIVGAVAPLLIPGPGGFIVSQLAASAAQRAPTRPPASAIRAGAPLVRPTCRPMGVIGRAFSAPFQARNFPTGGAFPGRQLVFTGGRIPVGRDIIAPKDCPSRFVPTPITPVKAIATAEAAVAAIPPVPAVVVPPFRIPSLSRRGINALSFF